LFFYHRLSRERKPQAMIAAGPSNPQWVGLALRRDLGPTLPSGRAIVVHTSGDRLDVVGRFGRALPLRMPGIAWLLLTTSTSLHLECGRS
jgi:hypothetical protein